MNEGFSPHLLHYLNMTNTPRCFGRLRPTVPCLRRGHSGWNEAWFLARVVHLEVGQFLSFYRFSESGCARVFGYEFVYVQSLVFIHTQRIHFWYICLHLADFYDRRRYTGIPYLIVARKDDWKSKGMDYWPFFAGIGRVPLVFLCFMLPWVWLNCIFWWCKGHGKFKNPTKFGR